MQDKVKRWVYDEYNTVIRNRTANPSEAIDRCYGVLMFAINCLFDDYNEELARWWDDEMLPKFRKLEWRR